MVGGTDSTNVFSSIEVFPPSAACSIPPLPQPRGGHSLSPLSEGRLVICGGFNSMTLANHSITQPPLNSCIFWVAGNTNWALLYNMRWLKLKAAELQYTSWWDGSGMKFEMGGMDPTCCHPKLDSKYGNTEIQL